MTTRLPVAALVLASVMWGTAVSGTKFALHEFTPATLLAVSLAGGTVVLWGVTLARGRPAPPSWRRAAVLGMFEPALAYIGDMFGLARTSAANGALLSGLESVFVVLLAALVLHELITRRIAVAVVLALVGLAILEGGGSFSGPGVGDMLILAGMLSGAAYTIVARGTDPDSDPLTVTTYQFTVAALLVLPVTVTDWATHPSAIPDHVAARFWVAAILVGVIGFAASFLLYNYAIVSVPAGPASVILNLIPVFGLVSATLWLGDSLTTYRLLGAGLIGLSVTIFAVAELRGADHDPRLTELGVTDA